MFEMRKLTSSDKAELEKLIDITEANLLSKEYWIPLIDAEKEHLLDDDWTYFLGMFDGEKLIGANALFFDESEFGDLLKYCENIKMPVAEIGASMVLPEYRGNNILLKINQKLLQIAKKLGLKTLVLTIHPNNIPSQASYKKIGAKKVANIVRNETFVRDVLTITL